MILVIDNEVRSDYRYLGPELARILDADTYHIAPEDPNLPELDQFHGVVLSGSTASVYEEEHEEWLEPVVDLVHECIDRHLPTLGVCFGHQLVHEALGGTIEQDRRRATFVELMSYSPESEGILHRINPIVPVLHADLVTDPGENMERIASTDYNRHFCSRHEDAPLWTVQYHPEFTTAVVDQANDFTPGEHSFEESNAVDTLARFRTMVDQQ